MSIFTNPRFTIAPDSHIKRYEKGVNRLLDILQHPEALVTDLSDLRDFNPDAAVMRVLGNAFKRIIHMNELIWELAKEIDADDPS